MKKFLSQKLASLLVINMFVSLIAPPIWAQGAAPQVVARHRAIINAVTGTVEVKVVGTTSWVPAVVNREVKTGDKVRTSSGAKCKIKVGDVGDFDIGAASEITVGDLQQVKTTARAFFMMQKSIVRDDVGMDLKSGDMRSGFHRIEGRVGNYNVSTPVAVAGVRGTQFELDLDGGKPWYEKMSEAKGDGDEEQLTATVLEGNVHLAGPNWERDVLTGQQLVATRGQVPGGVKPADDTKLQNIEDGLKAPADKTAPVFVGATSATRLSPASVKVQWTPATDDSSAMDKIVYDIYATTSSASQDFNAPTATSPAGATQFTLTGLDENANYFIVVRARDEAGNRDANTKEVITGSGDAAAPAFSGASSVTKPTTTSALVTWSAASDNVTPAGEIVYDIYTATTSEGQSFTAPSATTAAGATSFTATDLLEFSDYYFVVRARDGAGNRDANKKEVTTFIDLAATPVDTFDTNAVITALTQKLFDDYTAKNQNDFMSAISSSFAGVNNSENALTAITLAESLKADFNVLSSVLFGHSITSITPFGGNRIGTNVTWSARYHFTTVDTETVQSGLTTNLLWDASSRPFQLVSWSGAAPFGLTVPSSGSTELAVSSTTAVPDLIASGGGSPVIVSNLPPPVLSSLNGPTAFDLTGNFQDFAPVRVTLFGTDFVNGAKVEESGDGGSTWNDVAIGTMLTQASVFFTSSSELDVDFSQFSRIYFPHMPLSFTEYFRVVNPDGQTSAAVASPVISQQPGPLNLTTVTTDRPVTTAPNPTPYNFTVQGFNIVTPGSFAGPAISAAITQGGSPVANFNVSSASPPVLTGSSSATSPMTLSFDAMVSGGGIAPGTYDVQVMDARGQSSTIAFNVTSATAIVWATNQNLSSNFDPGPGVTLTINSGVTVTGNGYSIVVKDVYTIGSATLNNAPLDVRAGGTALINGATLQNCVGGPAGLTAGLTMSGGSTSITNGTISGNGGDGISASGGSLSMTGTGVSGNFGYGINLSGALTSCSLSNLSVSGSGIALHDNTSSLVTVTGGNYASTSSEAMASNGGGMTIGGSTTISSASTDGVHVMSSGTVTITGANISGATTGILVDATAGGVLVDLTSTTVSGTSIGIAANAGTIRLNNSNAINGAGVAAIDLNGGSLDVPGTSNTITGTGGAQYALQTRGGSGVSITGTGTTISGGSNAAFNITGSGAVSLNATAITNLTCDGIFLDNSSVIVTITGGSINANRGIALNGNTGGQLTATGTTFSGYGFGLAVSRPAPPSGTGPIVLNQCPGANMIQHDASTAGPLYNPSTAQWNNLVNNGDRINP